VACGSICNDVFASVSQMGMAMVAESYWTWSYFPYLHRLARLCALALKNNWIQNLNFIIFAKAKS